MTAAPVTLDDVMQVIQAQTGEIRALREQVARLEGARQPVPVDPVAAALAAIATAFRGQPCTAAEIIRRADALDDTTRLLDPLRRAFGKADARSLGKRLADMADAEAVEGFVVERVGGRERVGNLWIVRATADLV